MAEDFGGMRGTTELMLAVGLIIESFEDIVFNEPAGMHQVEQLLGSDAQVLAQHPEDFGSALAFEEGFFHAGDRQTPSGVGPEAGGLPDPVAARASGIESLEELISDVFAAHRIVKEHSRLVKNRERLMIGGLGQTPASDL